MDDDSDPYAKYLKPSGKSVVPAAPAQPASAASAQPAPAAQPGDDPYSKYVPSKAPAASPAQAAPSAPAAAPPPDPNAPPEWAVHPLGAVSKVGDLIGDAMTFGLADTLAGLGGKGKEMRAATEKERADVGPVASTAADITGYTVGPGMANVGGRIAGSLGGNLLARAFGSGVESAGANVAGTLGHGDVDPGDLVRAGGMGALIGAATGAIPGARGENAPVAKDTPGWFGTSIGAKTANSPTPGLKADVKTAFDPLTTVKIDPGHLGPGFDAVTSSLSSGMKTDMGDQLSSTAEKISNEMANKFRSGDTITADDIAKFQKSLGRAGNAPGAGPSDSVIAQQYSDALSKGVKNATPSSWGSVTPGTDLSEAISQANTAANKAKTSAEIDDWIRQAQRKPDAVPDAVDKALTDNPQFYQTHPDLAPMLQTVADSRPGIWSKIGGRVAGSLAGAAIGGGAEYIGGQNPITGLAEGGLTGLLLGHAAGQLRSSDLVAKLAAARHLNATGQALPASSFSPGIRVLSPLAIYGPKVAATIGASGAFVQPEQH